MSRPFWRRLRMGAATLLGLKRQGFFTPYRYADSVSRPEGYPELEAIFHQAEPAMREVLSDIDAAGDHLAALEGPPPVPRWNQSWFPRLDGAAAFAIARRSAPQQIIEVGSGHSTRMLAHAAPSECRITCIDPSPRAVLNGLDIDWRQEVLGAHHMALFTGLGPGDIAFFDSSHVLWEGTDVDMMLGRILPSLSPGVLVHVHDIVLPDPYPLAWSWRGYTEQLGLAGYLSSPAWKVVWSSHYAATRMDAGAAPGVARLPLPEGAHETSLWLRRA